MLTNNNLHIVMIGYKTKTEVKQAVRKKINKKRYLYPLTVSLSSGVAESMVLTLFGLLTRRSSHEGCRDRCHGKPRVLLYTS